MKKLFEKIKVLLPSIKDKLITSLPILLFYQSILFLLSNTLVNQIFLFFILLIYVTNQILKG